MGHRFDEFTPHPGDFVGSTRPDVDRLPPDEKYRVGIVIERVPAGHADNGWAVDMFRVLWTGPGTGPSGRLSLEPDHRLRVLY